ADLTGADYQWIDCNNNNQILIGETNQTFVAAINGIYAVIIDNGICSDTSSCFAITTVGMDEILDTELVKVYPNPTNDIVTITSSELLKSIEILNSLGQKNAKFIEVNQTSQELNFTDEPGVYF